MPSPSSGARVTLLSFLTWVGLWSLDASGHAPASDRLRAVDQLVTDQPARVDLRLERSRLLYEVGRDDDSWRDAEIAWHLDPAAAGPWRVQLLLALGRLGEAQASLPDLLEHSGTDPSRLLLVADVYETSANPGGASQFLEDYLARVPRPDPEVFLRAARLILAADPKASASSLRILRTGLDRLGPVPALLAAVGDTGPRLAPPTARWPEAPTAFSITRPRTAPSGMTVVLPRNSVWAFDTTGTDLGTTWRETGFMDDAWPRGPGILGYGETYVTTVVPFGPDSLMKYPTQYFRTAFTFSGNVNSISDILLSAMYDDGLALYLNGQEILRRALPAGPLAYTTAAFSHEGGAYETIDVTAHANNLTLGVNTLAAEVHQHAPESSDLVFDLELSLSTQIGLTRGPYLQRAAPHGMVIRWRTNVRTPSVIHYAFESSPLEQVLIDTSAVTEHQMVLTGLIAATRYRYTVGTPDTVLAGENELLVFTTPPSVGTAPPVRAWVVGDCGTGGANAAGVRNGYLAFAASRPADLWLMLGDNAYPLGTDADYQKGVFDMYREILPRLPLWTTRGNHDLLYPGAADDYYDIFTLPDSAQAGGIVSGTEAYYAFDHANIHFLCLDSEGSNRDPGGAMLTWLAADIAATSQDWVIAFWHHPPYTKGSHDSDNPLDSGGRLVQMRENVLPVLEAGGVDLVLTGHSHSYERSKLLDGHYGFSATLSDSLIVDGGNGRIGEDGAYLKPTLGPTPHEGAVYVVTGSAGQISGGALDHPAMLVSLNILGSVVLDIDANQLDAAFLDTTGTEQDHFTIVKGIVTAASASTGGLPFLTLSPPYPNPASGEVRLDYVLPAAGWLRLDIHDVAGRRVRALVTAQAAAGPYRARWDGRDDERRPLAAGVYFAVLTYGNRTQTRKIILRP